MSSNTLKISSFALSLVCYLGLSALAHNGAVTASSQLVPARLTPLLGPDNAQPLIAKG